MQWGNFCWPIIITTTKKEQLLKKEVPNCTAYGIVAVVASVPTGGFGVRKKELLTYFFFIDISVLLPASLPALD